MQMFLMLISSDLFFLLIILNKRQKRANTTPQICNRINVAITARLIDAMPIFGTPSMGVYPRIEQSAQKFDIISLETESK